MPAVGGIESRKRSLELLDAYAVVHKHIPDVQLVIAGGEPGRAGFLHQTGVLGALHFLGQAKVVGLARTWSEVGIAMAERDVVADITKPRQLLQHLDERKPAVYRTGYGEAWTLVRVRGSHRHYVHSTKPGVVTVPGKLSRDLPIGTERSILKQAGINRRPR